MLEYIRNKYTALYLTDAAGNPTPCDLLDGQGVSLLTGSTPVFLPPNTFATNQWSVSTGSNPAQININVSVLPAANGNPITKIQYRVGTGAWQDLPDAVIGTYPITMPANSTAYSISLQAINVVGPSGPSAAKTATSGAAATTAPAMFAPAQWTLTTGTEPASLILNVVALPADGGSAIASLEYRVGSGEWVALSGTDTGPRTITMPAAGTAYSVVLRAVNAVGAGAPSAAKTATSTAPQVAMTVTNANGIMQNAAVGTVVATIISDATTLTLGGADVGFLRISGSNNVVTTKALTGKTSLSFSVTGTRSGYTGRTITATVPVSPVTEVPSDTPITTNIGTVASYEPNGDTPAFTLTGTGNAAYNKRYVVPTSVTVDGYGHMAEPMTLNKNTSGAQPTWTIASLPLIVWPADDVGEFMISIRASGVEVATQFPYTRDPGDELRKVSAFVVLPNAKSEMDGATVEYEIVLQEAAVFNYTPRFFPSGSPPAYVRWSLPNGIPASPGHLFFTRFVIDPSAGDTTFGTTIFALTGATLGDVKTGIQINNDASPSIGIISRSAPYSNLGGTLSTKVPIDVFASITNTGAAKGMLSINGGAWSSFAQGGGPDSYAGVVAAQIAGVRMNRGANGLSQYSHRAALWLGLAVDPELHIEKFIKADGSLEHPLVAVNAFGQPAIDFYNNANHGSFGAPTTMVG